MSVSLKYVDWHWDNLSVKEKELIFGIINSDTEDSNWMKAIFLCSENPKEEIVEKITGNKLLFKKTTKELIIILPEKLLQTCLRTFIGDYHYYPSWLYANSFCNKEFWKKMIEHILINEDETYFEICLLWFLNRAVNGFLDAEYKDEVWSELCKNSKNKILLTKELIYHISCVNLDYTKAKSLWTILLNIAKEEKIENEIISTIVDNIELLQQTMEKKDIFDMFDRELLFKIHGAIIPDFDIYSTLVRIDNDKDIEQEEINRSISFILEMVKQLPIRFFFTFELINKIIPKLSLPIDLRQAVLNLPNFIKETGESEQNKIRKQKKQI